VSVEFVGRPLSKFRQEVSEGKHPVFGITGVSGVERGQADGEGCLSHLASVQDAVSAVADDVRCAESSARRHDLKVRVRIGSEWIEPSGKARCRVRIYLPDDDLDAPVVVCSELLNNPGGSIADSVEVIAAGVIRANELPTPLVWIEHWPSESTNGERRRSSWSSSLATRSRRGLRI
jgi:hypothetical protein